MKDFILFALRKRLIVDEKELESLFKDLNGDETLASKPFLQMKDF